MKRILVSLFFALLCWFTFFPAYSHSYIGPGNEIKKNQIPAEWVELFKYTSLKSGNGYFYLNLQGDGTRIRSLEIIKEFSNSKSGTVLYHYKSIPVQSLQTKTVVFEDPNERPLAYMTASKDFSDISGGMITVHVLSEGSIWGPSYDKFTKFQFRISENSHSFFAQHEYNSKFESFNLLNFCSRLNALGLEVGVRQITFVNDDKVSRNLVLK